MKHLSPFVAALSLLLLLTACGTAPLAVPGVETMAGTSAVYPSGGVAFLPPIGPDVDTRDFYPGASLTIEVTAKQGGALLQSYSTDAGTIRVEDGFYLGLWRVRDAVAMTAPAVTEVRVSVYGEGLGSAVVAEACPDDARCLLGHFDAAIRRSRSQRSGGDVLDLTRAQTLPVKVFLQGPGFRPQRLGDLARLSDGLSFEGFEDPNVRSGNCVVTEFTGVGAGFNALGAGFNALGAGFNALGAVGGLALFGAGSIGTTSSDLRLLDVKEAGWLADAWGGSWQVEDTALLVVDDFGGVYDLDPELVELSLGLDEAGLVDLVTGGGFSHGALVMHQVVQMLDAIGFVEVFRLGPAFRIFERASGLEWEYDAPPAYLVVAAVDTLGFNTDVIAGKISNALNALRYYSDLNPQDGFDVRRVAINMSFVIVPCSVLDDLEAFNVEGGFDIGEELPDFEAYVAALAAENGVADDFYAELTGLLVEPLGGSDEPLRGVTESCSRLVPDIRPTAATSLTTTASTTTVAPQSPPFTSPSGVFVPDWQSLVERDLYGELLSESPWPCNGTAIYVASSGNFGLDYAMYPAAWPLVVSVSSQDAVSGGFSPEKSQFSNSGEVMAPGSLFELGRSSEADPQLILGYAGTSFAAPVVSLFTALDLMQWYPACAYSPATSLLTNAADDGNEDLGEAVRDYCYGGYID